MSANSPAPGTPQTANKAINGGILAFIGAFIFALWASIQGRPEIDTLKATDWLIIILGAVVTALGAAGATYQTKNRAL